MKRARYIETLTKRRNDSAAKNRRFSSCIPSLTLSFLSFLSKIKTFFAALLCFPTVNAANAISGELNSSARINLERGRISFTMYHKKLTVDHKKLTVDNKELTVDHKELTVDRKELTEDRKELTEDHKELTVDRKEFTEDHKELTVDRKGCVTNRISLEKYSLAVQYNNFLIIKNYIQYEE